MEEQPTLLFNGHEVPLVKISKNKFKFRKNSEAFKILNGAENASNFKFVEGQKKIESFCLVSTFEIKIEASILLYTLRQHHNEPVYVLTDSKTKKYLDRFNFENVRYLIKAEKEDLDIAQKKIGDRFKNIHTFHKPECILKKMDVMDHALSIHSNTFFLDSDLIILKNLQENFSSPLCLSPHFHADSILDDFTGIFNAGYIFCADKNFPSWWRDQYLNSDSFYEQECLNRAELFFDIQAFNEDHNVGFWRQKLNLSSAKSVHLHLSSYAENRMNGPSKDNHVRLKSEFLDFYKNDEKFRFIHNETNKEKLFGRKLAFVHFGKTGGVYLNHYLRCFVFDNLEDKNQWRQKHNGEIDFARDWTNDELIGFLDEKYDNVLVHNHHNNWDEDVLKEYKKRGWFSFMFLRHPCDLLCSLYFFSRRNLKNTGVSATNPDGVLAGYKASDSFVEIDIQNISLNEFIVKMVEDKNQHVFWRLPDYIDSLDSVMEINDENLELFFKKYFSHEYIRRPKINSSQNLGYRHYLMNGEIKPETYTLLMGSKEARRYEKYIDLV